jgi:hypothetical protein
MEQALTQSHKSICWVLRSQEEAIRSALEDCGEWKVHSVEVRIETVPGRGSTPTFHRFAVRVFVGLTTKGKEIFKDADQTVRDTPHLTLRERVRVLLDIPAERRNHWTFGDSLEKPGLFQIQYKSGHQWTSWETP